jgi:hypothetical protein
VAKYTDEQLATMAEDTLYAYNSGDQRGDMVIGILSSMTQQPPQVIVSELYRLCANKESIYEP